MKIEDLPCPANYRRQMAKNGGYEMVPAYTAEEVLGILEGVQMDAVPENCDVRKILLDIGPGWDGMGEEFYAESIADVESKLSEMGERLEEWEIGIRNRT